MEENWSPYPTQPSAMNGIQRKGKLVLDAAGQSEGGCQRGPRSVIAPGRNGGRYTL